MASIHHHPRSPYWMAHFVEDGKRTTRSTRVKATEEGREKAQALADAWEQAAILAGDGRDGRAWALGVINQIFAKGGAPVVREKRESWESVAADFLKNLRMRRKASASTLAGYTTGLAVFAEWLGARARKDIAAITPRVIDQYVTYLQGRYSTTTVDLRLTQISGVFVWAVRQEIVDRNPVAKVDRPAAVAMQRTPFTMQEVAAMIRTAREEVAAGRWNAGDMLTLLLLGACTGARLMDCARMRWESVDLDGGRLSYLPQKKARSGQILTIAIVDPLLSHLRSLDRSGPWVLPEFHKVRGSDLSFRFRSLMDRAGIKVERTEAGRARAFRSKSFHGLRHTLATMLFEAGVDDLIRRRITGHEDRAVAAIYQHVSPEATGEALRKVLETLG